jgi:basic membrane protein A
VTKSPILKPFGRPGVFLSPEPSASNPTLDVLFAVGGLTGNGVLDAACDKGIWAIGVDVDQYVAYTADQKCLLTSAEKHLSASVDQAIKALDAANNGGAAVAAGPLVFDATNDGVGVSDFHTNSGAVPSDLQGKLDAALEAVYQDVEGKL